MSRTDPVGDRYYPALIRAERYTDYIFWCAAALSLVILLIDRPAQPVAFEITQSLFAISVVALFVSNLTTKLYLSTSAQIKRSADFLSNAFSVHLIAEPTREYYSNAESVPFRKMAASLLENTMYSKRILKEMLITERYKVFIYGSAWAGCLFYRATDIATITALAQLLFSEQIISRWVRMEWLKKRTEQVYDSVYELFAIHQPLSREFCARSLEYLLQYETGKAQAGLSLSSPIFHKLHDGLKAEWTAVSTKLAISSRKPPQS